MRDKRATIIWAQSDGALCGEVLAVIQAPDEETTLGDLQQIIDGKAKQVLSENPKHKLTWQDIQFRVVEALEEDEKVIVYTRNSWFALSKRDPLGKITAEHNAARLVKIDLGEWLKQNEEAQ